MLSIVFVQFCYSCVASGENFDTTANSVRLYSNACFQHVLHSFICHQGCMFLTVEHPMYYDIVLVLPPPLPTTNTNKQQHMPCRSDCVMFHRLMLRHANASE